MKEKMKQLANGVFTYDLPPIVLSEDTIEFNVEAGKIYSGKFTIQNQKCTLMRGIVYSSQRKMKVINPAFTEAKNIINYELNANNVSPGETIRGVFSVVSDCGEVEIPFAAVVSLPYCMTSIGKIRDLFHFANLAKTDWVEALKLFKSGDFKRVFLYRDLKNTIIYESLIKSISTSQALEEFLIAIHKKLRINLVPDKVNLSYQVSKESFMDKITLTKDNWGFAEIKISTDVPFIIPDHKMIWADNFIGNHYFLEYVIEPKLMRNGKNFGHLFISTIHQSFSVEIMVDCEKGKQVSYPGESALWNASLKKHQYQTTIVENYMKFRGNKITAKQYLEDTEELLNHLEEIETSPILELIIIHMCIIDGRTEKANTLLREFEIRHENIEKTMIVEFSGYLYLKALLTKEESIVAEAYNRIRSYYTQGYKDFRILWFLLYLDKNYLNNKKKKLDDLMEQFLMGCHSPILYYEAISILNEEPVLMKELDDTIALVLNWAVKHKEVNRDVAMQYTYLAGRRKTFHPLIYKSLIAFYEQYQSKEILTAICSLLIKGRKTGEKYFKWYNLGVKEQLRITELHEYYMYSVNENVDIALPPSLLHYFVYNSNLNDRKKIYLYANIIKNKENNPTVYAAYLSAMGQFAMKQIYLRNVSQNLSIIYEEILSKEMITESLALHLPYIMFRYEIYCENPNIIGVFVVHKELKKELFVPLENKRAQINIFTENVSLFLVDKRENRYVCTIEYTLNKLLHLDDYAGTCYDLVKENDMLVLNLSEQIENYHKYDQNLISIKQKILGMENLRERYKSKGMFGMIQHYYDNFEGEKLEAILKNISLTKFHHRDQIQIMEYTIIRGLYDKAAEEIFTYGYEEVNIKYLLRLFGNLLPKDNEEDPNKVLMELGYYIFQSGKYNEELLVYLLKNYEGTTKEMYELWKACDGFELDTLLLEERLLGQMLFTEIEGLDNFSVFESYYNKKGGNAQLIRAFLSYYSFLYLINDYQLPCQLFDFIKKQSYFEENQTGMFALLKYLSDKDSFTEDEKKLVDYNLYKYVQKGIIFPFYKSFRGKVSIPSGISNQYFVEYRANPSHRVMIYYILENEENQTEYTKEVMVNMYHGIFVKAFTLFYNESLQYYIVEEIEGEEHITKSVTIKMDNLLDEEEDKYNLINLMLMTREMQDEKTLFQMMEHYIETEAAAIELFQTL